KLVTGVQTCALPISAGERRDAAPRLAGDERVASVRNGRQQPPQPVVLEMMEKEVGQDHIPVLCVLLLSWGSSPFDYIRDQRPQSPAQMSKSGTRRACDQRLPVEQRQLNR